MDHSRVALIVGAGIGGLAAGVALQRAGWRVRVFERAASPRELGFALNLAPNAMAALAELGLAAPVLAEGHKPMHAEVRRANGCVLRRIDISRWQSSARHPTVIALRPTVHGALLAAIAPEAIELESEAVDFALAGDRVRLTLRSGRSVEGDLLLGADGVRSAVRRRLFPDEPPPQPSRYAAVRGVSYEAAACLGGLCAILYLDRGIEAAAVKAGGTAVYWYMSLLTDDLPPGDRQPTGIVDFRTRDMEDVFRAIVLATKAQDFRFDDLMVRDPIDAWGHGPVTLLGDAAHPMLPHTGQGAAQAIEDAVALGLALRNPDTFAALRTYERARIPRTRRVVRSGPRIARVTTTRNPVIGWLRNTTIRMVPLAFVRAGLDRAGRHDPHRALR